MIGILGKLIEGISYVLQFLISIRILIEIIMAYVDRPMGKNNMVGFFFDFTEPVIKPFRKVMPPSSVFDISPLVAIGALQIFTILILNILKNFQNL